MALNLSRLIRLADRYGAGFLVYAGISVVSAFAEWSSFAAAFSRLGPIGAAFWGFLVATIVNYCLSRLAFRSARNLLSEFVLLMGASGIAFAGNLAAFLVLIHAFSVPPLTAKVLGTVFGFFFNYLVRQFFIFSKVPRYGPLSAARDNLQEREKG